MILCVSLEKMHPKNISSNKRYAACVASAEKARLNVALSAVSTDIRAQGITDVAEKILFDGDGGTLDAADLGTDEFVHLRRNSLPPKKRKKSKLNRIKIWIYFQAKNKSIGEDLFLDTKSKIDFSSLNIQNIAD